jgi:hypothetical protein
MPLPYQETLHIGATISITVIRAAPEDPTTLAVASVDPLVELSADDKARVVSMLEDSEP